MADNDLSPGVLKLEALEALGIALELDDFGTGYSSLGYLRRLPVQTVKLDRSFISGIAVDPAPLAIVEAVTTMAHAIGMEVAAEGIETAEQLALLRQVACDRGQGYYFARPLPPADLSALLPTATPVA